MLTIWPANGIGGGDSYRVRILYAPLWFQRGRSTEGHGTGVRQENIMELEGRESNFQYIKEISVITTRKNNLFNKLLYIIEYHGSAGPDNSLLPLLPKKQSQQYSALLYRQSRAQDSRMRLHRLRLCLYAQKINVYTFIAYIESTILYFYSSFTTIFSSSGAQRIHIEITYTAFQASNGGSSWGFSDDWR